MKDPTHRMNGHLLAVAGYVPGRQPAGEGWIKLNTNESPYAPPAAVLEAIADASLNLQKYPDPRAGRLRSALGQRFGWDPAGVIVGNGSDDILNLLARAYGGPDRRIVQTEPSYSLYPVITALTGGRIHSVALPTDLCLPVAELVDAQPDLIFLTCPNAPTGVRFSRVDLRRLLLSATSLVVIDEAYAEFAEEDAIPLLRDFPNLFITRTFSKAYGLAGLRVGYGLGDPRVVAQLDKIRDSYNVNALSQAGALAALGEQVAYAEFIRRIKTTRERVRRELLGAGWQVYPSETNFLLAAPVNRHGQSGVAVAEDLFAWLEAARILVRRFPSHQLTAAHLRISIGSESQMDTFLEKVQAWKASASAS